MTVSTFPSSSDFATAAEKPSRLRLTLALVATTAVSSGLVSLVTVVDSTDSMLQLWRVMGVQQTALLALGMALSGTLIALLVCAPLTLGLGLLARKRRTRTLPLILGGAGAGLLLGLLIMASRLLWSTAPQDWSLMLGMGASGYALAGLMAGVVYRLVHGRWKAAS